MSRVRLFLIPLALALVASGPFQTPVMTIHAPDPEFSCQQTYMDGVPSGIGDWGLGGSAKTSVNVQGDVSATFEWELYEGYSEGVPRIGWVEGGFKTESVLNGYSAQAKTIPAQTGGSFYCAGVSGNGCIFYLDWYTYHEAEVGSWSDSDDTFFSSEYGCAGGNN